MRHSLFLAAMILVGCDSSDADQPIELGHVFPPAIAPGDEELAIKLAVEEWNKDPGALPAGRKIRLRHAPGGATPNEWAAQATRLVALEQVVGLFGGDRSPVAERIGMAVQGENVVAISTAGWAGPTPSENLFTVGLTPGERGRALAEQARAVNPRTVVVVRDSAALAAGVAADRFLAELLVSHPTAAVRTVDVKDAERPAADVVFLACSAGQASRHREQFPDALVLFGDEDAELPALLAEGRRSEGMIVATAFNPADRSERLAAFAGRYQEQYKRPPTVAAVLAHDALSIWLEAARRAGTLEAADIRAQLVSRDRPYEVLAGTLTFAEDHTAQRPAFVGKLVGGQITPIRP